MAIVFRERVQSNEIAWIENPKTHTTPTYATKGLPILHLIMSFWISKGSLVQHKKWFVINNAVPAMN